MLRPIIFVATADPLFESIALEAILSTYHGMRRTGDMDAACTALAAGTGDLALAIIDLDPANEGLPLLRILGGCEPDFPILVVTSEPDDARNAELVSEIAIDWLRKPVDVETLRGEIRMLCKGDRQPRKVYSGAPNECVTA